MESTLFQILETTSEEKRKQPRAKISSSHLDREPFFLRDDIQNHLDSSICLCLTQHDRI